jgi:NAD(P)H-hydrate epimerase
MEQAGWGVAQEAMRLLGVAAGKSVLILVGPGNNGGDGLVIARHLHDAGAHITLYLWHRNADENDTNRRLCRARAIPEVDSAADTGQQTLRRLLSDTVLVIDALLGLGVNRAIHGELAHIITAVNTHLSPAAHLLAVDLPTGIDADTGAVHGVAIQADVTIATGALKRGMLLQPAREFLGTIHVVDIGFTQQQLEVIMSEQINADEVRRLLPKRPNDSHKGTFGKTMVVAGSLLYPGAASLASSGALRVGAGLVTLATGRSVVMVPGRPSEITLRPLPEEGWGVLGLEAARELLGHLEGYTALLIGPGLGREEPTKAFLNLLLGLDTPRQRGAIGFRIGTSQEKPSEQRHELPPTVIDADGLNLLSDIENWWQHLPKGHAVLTPHPGEMKRLLKIDELPGDPVQAAAEAAKQWGQIVVLKGATTVVANPEGRTAINDGGNAALATAGTGDVLSGAIAGLLTQGLLPFEAAVAGVYLHSLAGRILRDDMGDAGTIASDLLARLPLAIKSLKK